MMNFSDINDLAIMGPGADDELNWLAVRNEELQRSNELLMSEVARLRGIERSLDIEESGFAEEYRSGFLGVLLARLDGGLIYANDAFLEMIGCSREYFAQEKITWKDIFASDHALEACGKDGSYRVKELKLIKKDSALCSIALIARRMVSRPDQIIGFALKTGTKFQVPPLDC